MKKIFISHSHFDKFFAERIIEIIEKIGISNTQIICSSVVGYGVPLGENFIDEIKKWLKEDIIVIFLLSQNYYSSPFSLCEMGASWITAKKVFPISIPPFTLEEFKGVFQQHIEYRVNDKYELSVFKEQIEKAFNIDKKLRGLIWEQFRDKKLIEINNEICKINKIQTKSLNEESFEEEVLIKEKPNIKEKDNHEKNKPQMVLIKANKFTLGNSKFGSMQVKITNDFLISQQLVTQELFELIMGYNNSFFKGSKLPIENIKWLEAISFCNKLSENRGLLKYYQIADNEIKINNLSNGYRLPTEAEWEYVCLQQMGSEDIKDLKKNAWFSLNSEQRTHKVGQKPQIPNAVEVFDLLGNVWEWCFDDYVDYLNNNENTITDRVISIGNNKKVIRGASYASTSSIVNLKHRDKRNYKYKSKDLGFRIFKNS